MKSKKYCVILLVFTVFLSIVGFLSIKAISVYSVYSENYRDTIYVEVKQPKPKYNKYEMIGKPSGIVQSGFINNGKRFITIRRFDNSELENIQVGGYDYRTIEVGDTIIGKANEVEK